MKLISTRVLYRDELKFKKKLLQYFPTSQIRKARSSNYSDEDLSDVNNNMRTFLQNKNVNSKNVADIWQTLLQIEDIELMSQYSRITQRGVLIKKFGGEYSVKLKNIPKDIKIDDLLSPADEIVLIPSSSQTNTKMINDEDPFGKLFGNLDKFDYRDRNKGKRFYGLVYRCTGSTVCFQFRKLSPTDIKIKYDIVFRPSRLTLIYQYCALASFSKNAYLRDFLFPVINFNSTPSNISLQLFDETLETNPEQMQAVMNIADGPNSSAPYIIFGPPGTGKTTTIVESILQLVKRGPEQKILVTAGSNAACDEVAKRLCKQLSVWKPNDATLLRIFAVSGEKRLDNMDEDLVDASNLCHHAHFYPSLETIYQYSIIVVTLSVAGKLVSGGIGPNFFTHVFIDECAASTEPEALVAISGIMSRNARLIIAGDPKQLGPILQSRRAVELGLDRSLMERLMSYPLYEVDDSGNYDRSIQTRLVRNFRTHSDILKIPNLLYYDGELKACASDEITKRGLGWHKLPNKDFPIVFNSVNGICERPYNSTSYYNHKELESVLDYVKDLMFFGINGQEVKETDIGIISPYKKQYTRIQEELHRRHWYKIECGSVETFQGKEKPIIIVSMVRSSTNTVGFLDNPKRLNVTLTRAQALLIIIGNPMTLEQIPDWKSVIEYCRENRAFSGARIEFPRMVKHNGSDESLSTISSKISNLNLNKQTNYGHRNRNRNRDHNYNGYQNRNKGNSSKASGKSTCEASSAESPLCVSSVESWLVENEIFQKYLSNNMMNSDNLIGDNDSLLSISQIPSPNIFPDPKNMPNLSSNTNETSAVNRRIQQNKETENNAQMLPQIQTAKASAIVNPIQRSTSASITAATVDTILYNSNTVTAIATSRPSTSTYNSTSIPFRTTTSSNRIMIGQNQPIQRATMPIASTKANATTAVWSDTTARTYNTSSVPFGTTTSSNRITNGQNQPIQRASMPIASTKANATTAVWSDTPYTTTRTSNSNNRSNISSGTSSASTRPSFIQIEHQNQASQPKPSKKDKFMCCLS